MYWQQEWPMLSYSIYVVCSLYVTFSPYCFIIIARLMPIYKVYTIGQTWSGPVMSAAACFYFGLLRSLISNHIEEIIFC